MFSSRKSEYLIQVLQILVCAGRSIDHRRIIEGRVILELLHASFVTVVHLDAPQSFYSPGTSHFSVFYLQTSSNLALVLCGFVLTSRQTYLHAAGY